MFCRKTRLWFTSILRHFTRGGALIFLRHRSHAKTGLTFEGESSLLEEEIIEELAPVEAKLNRTASPNT